MRAPSRLAALCCFAASPSLAWADPPRAEVERLLGGYEHVPAADDFLRLGAGTDRVLARIARDPSVSALRRVRALAALGVVPSTVGERTCTEVVARGGTFGAAPLMLSACAHTLARFPAAARLQLLALLEHPVAEVRIAAARSLAAAHIREANAALVARLAREPDADVRGALRDALSALGAPARK